MAQFTEAVTVVNRLAGRVHDWELCEPMSYRLVDRSDAEVVNVPPGFVTDFASVPRPVWFWIAPWGRHGRAAIVHDFLYRNGSVTDVAARQMRRPPKSEADRIFRDAMGVLDAVILGRSPLWRRAPAPLRAIRLWFAVVRRYLMWAAVALFGRGAYKKQQRKDDAPPLEHEMLVDVQRQLEGGAAAVPRSS
jgi:hypothetical protein